jgi:hypothetical protein
VVSVARGGRSRQHRYTLRLAGLTAFGFVLELLVVKEQLFAGCKNECGAAVDAGEYLILKFH